MPDEEFDTLPLKLAERIDGICDQFESARESGRSPQIEEFLEKSPTSERGVLLRALLEVELELTGREDSSSSVEDYQQRFPEYTDVIESVFKELPQQALADSPLNAPDADVPSGADENAADLGSISQYQLIAKLGAGGMGTVYKAVHTKLQRVVALKVLPTERMQNPDAVARFQREMRLIGRFDHPNIVRATDAGEEGGQHFLVMEYLEGLDLSKLLQQLDRLPIVDACEITRQTALALQHAHEQGLIHRDVKPSNLSLTPDGEVKLLDLGLARLLEAEPDVDELTGTREVIGTADYVAPEQIHRQDKVDIRADIYSLGCTLYKLATGTAPYGGGTFSSTYLKLKAHVEAEVPTLSEGVSDVPKPLEAVMRRMLAKKASDRPSTPGEVARVLQPFCKGHQLKGLLKRAGDKQSAVSPADGIAPATPSLISSALTDTDVGAGAEELLEQKSRAKQPVSGRSPTRSRDVKVRTPKWPAFRRGYLLTAAAAMLIAFGVVIYVKTGEGQLVLTVNEPDITITIDGKPRPDITITSPRDTIEIRLPVGKHLLEVTKDGFTADTEEFHITRNGRKELSAKLIPIERARSAPEVPESDRSTVPPSVLPNSLQIYDAVAARDQETRTKAITEAIGSYPDYKALLNQYIKKYPISKRGFEFQRVLREDLPFWNAVDVRNSFVKDWSVINVSEVSPAKAKTLVEEGRGFLANHPGFSRRELLEEVIAYLNGISVRVSDTGVPLYDDLVNRVFTNSVVDGLYMVLTREGDRYYMAKPPRQSPSDRNKYDFHAYLDSGLQDTKRFVFSAGKLDVLTRDGKFEWRAPQWTFATRAKRMLLRMGNENWEKTMLEIIGILYRETRMDPILKLQLMQNFLAVAMAGSPLLDKAFTEAKKEMAAIGLPNNPNFVDPDDVEANRFRRDIVEFFEEMDDPLELMKDVLAQKLRYRQVNFGGRYEWVGWLQYDKEGWVCAGPPPSARDKRELYVGGKMGDSFEFRKIGKAVDGQYKVTTSPIGFVEGRLLYLYAEPSESRSNADSKAGSASGGESSEFSDVGDRLDKAGAKSGEIQISLAWNNVNDLDLHVITPSGERIFFDHRNSSCGGELDVDMNAFAPDTDRPVENVYWPFGGAPEGQFRVQVRYYANQGGPNLTKFQVVVKQGGRVRTFTGEVSNPGGQPVDVHRFSSGPLDEIRTRQRFLPIAGSAESSDDVVLCQIGVTDPKHCELKLVDASFDDLSGTTLALKRRDEANASFWDVSQEATKGLGRPEKVGTFALKSGRLSFTWDAQGDRSHLPFCRLRINAGSGGATESETCHLWRPFEVKPGKMTFSKRDGIQKVLLGLPKGAALPPAECLRLEVELADFASVDLSESIKLESKATQKVDHVDPADMTTHLFTTELEFAPKGETNVLRLKHQAVVPKVRKRLPRVKIEDEETPIATSILKGKKAEMEKQLDALEKYLAEIESKIDESANAPESASRNKRLESETKRRTEMEDAVVKVEDALDWIESAEDACAEIEADGRIKLRLYRRVDGGDDVDILVVDRKAESLGGEDSSEFFGIKARGRRFVYIVDRSGSMQGRLLQRARTELTRAVVELNERQQFYVYFFASRTYPMFDPSPKPKSPEELLRATTENIEKLAEWVKAVTPGGGTNPQSAILEAFKFKPHAIFLLSDGRFDPNTPNIVRQSNTEKIPIHTIGFVHKVGEPGLKQIADESGGTYRFVP